MNRTRSSRPEYFVWQGMRARCMNPRSEAFENYGGRGITICERWNSFDAFYADMGPRPTPRHSIDRKNNDGNYEPGNCRWATSQEQRGNCRTPRTAVPGGRRKKPLTTRERVARLQAQIEEIQEQAS